MTADICHDKIRIDGLRVDCIVGLLPHERAEPQPVSVNLELWIDTDRAGSSGRLADTADYEWVATLVTFALKAGRFELLEMASRAIARLLLLPRASPEEVPIIQAVCLCLSKPEALRGRGIPSIEISRSRKDIEYVVEARPFGTVDVAHESPTVGIYRLNLSKGRSIPTHVHRRMSEVEMVLTHGLCCQGEPANKGSVRAWPLDLPHGYHNPSQSTQSILCIDRPRFDEDDEVLTETPPVPLKPLTVEELR